jgi:hypothetical protein
MHVYVLAEQQPLARYMASSCLAVGFVLCLGALVNSAQLITYPINFWIWFMFSCVVALIFWRAEVALAPAEEEGTEAKLAVAPRQPRRPATPRFGGRSLRPDSSIRI